MTTGDHPRRAFLRGAAVTAIGAATGTTAACSEARSMPVSDEHSTSSTRTTTTTTTSSPPPATTPSRKRDDLPLGARPPAGQRWVPYFSDEFESIDTTFWYRYDNSYGAGTKTQHWLLPRNLRADGTLKIVSKREQSHGREFTSGFLSTGQRGGHGIPAPEHDTFFPRSGFYEMRGKVTHAQGLLQACWLRHRGGAGVAEVDIMELFHSSEPGKTRQALHLDGAHNTYRATTFIEQPSADPGWHVWGVAILDETPDVRFRLYTDGRLVGEYLAREPAFWNDHSEPNLWDFSVDTYVGGIWSGHPDDPLGYSRYKGGFCLSSGKPPHCDATNLRSAHFPTTFEVDYVRIWRPEPVPSHSSRKTTS